MRIYEQFEKSLSAKENADFLKNEYGWGGSYPVIIGAGIDESHDGKGITITKGIGKENPHITLSWSQVEKRIGELIRMDRYLNPKEKEHYPRWLESQEERRTKIAETKRNREILSNAPPEQEVEPTEKEPEEAEQPQDVQYEYHLGDKVYIGASEYEILSVDDERVMLYDYDMPLFNKEFSRTEFDRKVRENPMNEHLIVKEEPAEERNEAEEVQTNMGSMPIEDYREIVASQSGFDSYDEMHRQGYRIGNGYDKEPEPVVPAWEQKKKVKGFDLHPDVPMADRHTFNLRENEVETVGKKERFRRNIMAIQLLKKCQEENRFATPEEQIVLSKYVGWGGLSEAFDENNSAWATEYLELSSVLTPEEYASARESTLTAFYTPPEVITAIYKAMEQMGFKEGNLLEPSCGIGNFIGMLPDSMQDSKIYGVELDTISAGIAQQLYQKTTIAAQGFEETNLPDSFFDGVVGNVPFGDFKVSDKRYDKHKFLIHDYFFAKSLDKLRPGGVMAFVTSKGTMDKETLAVRKYIAQRAELLGAIRLPNNTFKGTIQKFTEDLQLLTDRTNVICISDEAHRSQINLDQKVKITESGVQKTYGFAKYLHDSLPNATYVGFTGTPVDGTIEVFGGVVDAYTMTEAVKDGITVNLVYDGRAAKVMLNQDKVRQIEEYYAQCELEGANEHQVEESQKAVAKMEVIIGDPDRLRAVAEDFIKHYETRVAEGATVAGKAMFVCSNRNIAYDFYKIVKELRPEWTEKGKRS